LVDGILVEKPMGYFESHVACLIIKWIGSFLDNQDLGVVAGEAGMLRLSRGLVRIPDVSYVSWDRLPGRRVPNEPIPDLVPDLAVEVISPSNTEREMQRKLEEYFAAGVQLVWLVYPKTYTVEVFSSPKRKTVLRKSDTLNGGDVLPGFSVPLKKLFARPRGNA
jgi:Uma2 family endonuclease